MQNTKNIMFIWTVLLIIGSSFAIFQLGDGDTPKQMWPLLLIMSLIFGPVIGYFVSKTRTDRVAFTPQGEIIDDVLTTNGFSLATNKIDSIKLSKPWWCVLFGVISLLASILSAVLSVEEFTKISEMGDMKNLVMLSLISMGCFFVSIMFFGSVKLSIFSGSRVYKISAVFCTNFLNVGKRNGVLTLKEKLQKKLN